MRSLTQRLLLAATAVLILFLGSMGLILDAAIRDSLAKAVRERLQAHVYTLLAVAEVTPDGALLMPDELPEARFSRPDSGLYARIAGQGFDWQSPSSMGENPQLPVQPLAPGEVEFLEQADIGPEEAFVLRQGLAWEVDDGDQAFVIVVAEHERVFNAQVAEFRRTLWIWIGAGAALLLLVQLWIMRWGIRPVRVLAAELDDIKRGHAERIRRAYPRELELLTESLNAFITSERENLDRYRNRLSDLAHSLKTPLAVLRAALEGRDDGGEVITQIDRMDELVGYQLKRARAAGHLTLSQPVSIERHAEQIAGSLEKVHAEKQVACSFEIDPGAAFHGERGDLLELLGNLLDNAFKWCRREVVLTAVVLPAGTALRPGIRILVEDDGPGIAEDEVERVVRRGVRGDEQVPGHGIGLAIVGEIVDMYGGRIDIGRSDLGGARVTVEFPPR
ncbi:MAG: ATP-binding protein [Xanthomonadales bacterium]|nr:ATP-binding protein [Xanthomonadales bacterium]